MPTRGFETFEIELQNTLNNLYNPAYKPADILFEVIHLDSIEGLEAVRAQIIQAIHEMNSPEIAPRGSKGSFYCQLMESRFIQGMSQEKASELLDISTRHFRRKQQEAIHALALKIWEKQHRSHPEDLDMVAKKESEISRIETIAREIQVLTDGSPGVTRHLEEFLNRAVSMAAYLEKEYPFDVKVAPISDVVEIPLHPSVLRQIVFYIILCLVEAGFKTSLEIGTREENQTISLSFQSRQYTSNTAIEVPELSELVPALGGRAEVSFTPEGWRLELIFPKVNKIKILVIDDNPDQVYLYRKMLSMTVYELIHLPGGDELLAHIASIKPDLILMDILLPGIDGWDLLWQIRQNQSTAQIPVLICSVMGNDSMAKSLGANGYLIKPVDRKALLQLLDQFTPPHQASQLDLPA
jgi:CheY-like chemotaxis protein